MRTPPAAIRILALVALATGCAEHEPAPQAATPSPAPAVSTSRPPGVDYLAEQSCGLALRAISGDGLRDTATLHQIAILALKSSTRGISGGGAFVDDANIQLKAVQSNGSDPTAAEAEVIEALKYLLGRCTQAGLPG